MNKKEWVDEVLLYLTEISKEGMNITLLKKFKSEWFEEQPKVSKKLEECGL